MKLVTGILFCGLFPLYSMDNQFIKRINDKSRLTEKSKIMSAKQKLHGEEFFKRHPQIHKTLYGLFQGIQGVAIFPGSVILATTSPVLTCVGLIKTSPEFEEYFNRNAASFGIIAPFVCGGSGAILLGAGWLLKKLNKVPHKDILWNAMNLPKPENHEKIATNSAIAGVVAGTASAAYAIYRLMK